MLVLVRNGSRCYSLRNRKIMYRVKIVNQTTPIKNQMNLVSAHYIYTFHAMMFMCDRQKKMMTAGVLNEFPALLYVVAIGNHAIILN